VTVRVRLRIPEVHTGNRKHRSTGATTTRSLILNEERTEDVVGLGDNQPFSSVKTTKSGGLLNGTERSTRTGYVWTDYPADYFRIDPYASSHVTVPLPSLTLLATTLLKRTNPSRASVDALQNIIELRELPGLVKEGWDLGIHRLFKKIPRQAYRRLTKAAKLNLMFQFGILPLYSDIMKLTEFQSLVDARVRELRRLQERGLRRTIALGEWSESSINPSATIQSNGVRMHCKIEKQTKVVIRGHARWHVSQNFYESDRELRAKAIDAVVSNKLDPVVAYELIPWSWLIDYFVNLGDLVSLSRNSFNATHQIPRLMIHRTTTIKSSNHDTGDGGTVTCTPYQCIIEEKERRLVPSGLSAQFEFLSGTQMSILGSLYVVKTRYR